MKEISNYYSIIPMEVLISKELSDKAKLIYAELSSLDSKAGFAWCSNKYLAELFDVSVWTISKCIKELVEFKYIKCEYETDNARKIFLIKPIVKNLKTYSEKSKNPNVKNHKTLCEKQQTPIVKNANKESIDEKVNKESIKENNNSGAKAISFKKPLISEIEKYCKDRKNNIDARSFFDFYESKGWMIGKNKMKDWKAAVRTWEQRKKENVSNGKVKKANVVNREEYEKMLINSFVTAKKINTS